MSLLRVGAAAARFQLTVLRRSPDDLMGLLNAPLFTVIFLAITRHAGRPDLAGYAVLAPAVITVWSIGLLVSGEIIDRERSDGTLEALVATPTPLPVVLLGRVLPGWLQPACRLVFLSWATDLLRDALAAPVDAVLPRLGMVVGLGAVGWLAGFALLRGILRRVRQTGTLAHA